MNDFLVFENISKQFGANKVVNQVSFSVSKGEVFSLLGPSGCGKTTLLNLLGRLILPDSGSIDGLDEERISCIFQETRILPWKTVLENVLFPLKDLMPADQALEMADKFIRLVGLADARNAYPHQLSGGMRQRVSIARAFAYPGSVILMDEAFQNLDNQLKDNILTSFMDIWQSDRRTVILVTHDIREAIRMGQDIIFLDHRPLQIIDAIRTADIPAEQIRQHAADLYRQ